MPWATSSEPVEQNLIARPARIEPLSGSRHSSSTRANYQLLENIHKRTDCRSSGTLCTLLRTGNPNLVIRSRESIVEEWEIRKRRTGKRIRTGEDEYFFPGRV